MPAPRVNDYIDLHVHNTGERENTTSRLAAVGAQASSVAFRVSGLSAEVE